MRAGRKVQVFVACPVTTDEERAVGREQAMKTGSVRQLQECLESNQWRFIQAGTYLLLERLKQPVYRRLLKRVALIHMQQDPTKGFQLPLGLPLLVPRPPASFLPLPVLKSPPARASSPSRPSWISPTTPEGLYLYSCSKPLIACVHRA